MRLRELCFGICSQMEEDPGEDLMVTVVRALAGGGGTGRGCLPT